MNGNCFLTNDVETTSIVNGGLRDDTGIKVWKEGLPALLDLYDEFGVKATFFYIANFAKQCPDIVRMVQAKGHEIACHGLTHRHDKAFDSMPFEEQLEHLQTAKAILEDIAGEEVVSFRSPALRVNADTPKALIEAGFRFDSSVAPQRMDMFMSLGSKGKLQWFGAPRTPYRTRPDNLARKGDSPITEVPVSVSALLRSGKSAAVQGGGVTPRTASRSGSGRRNPGAGPRYSFHRPPGASRSPAPPTVPRRRRCPPGSLRNGRSSGRK